MLELKNVAVEQVFRTLSSKRLSKLANENVRTIQDLLDGLPKYSGYLSDYDFKQLSYAIRHVEFANKRGVEPEIYETKEYEDESLKYNDALNKGEVLLLSAPTTEYVTSFNVLRRLPIESIKRLLTLTNDEGKNFLISEVKRIGPKALPVILKAIEMYSDQIVRQSELTDSRDINLFTYQQEEKKEIVTEKYAEIIAYLLDNTKEFVWGEVSERQKNLYLSSVVNNRQMDTMVKNRMVNNVANYTTLPELEKVASNDYKVLKRFIKK